MWVVRVGAEFGEHVAEDGVALGSDPGVCSEAMMAGKFEVYKDVGVQLDHQGRRDV
jgi:hypothetical protein